MKKELVFSGVQPTGNLHLGNYLGALKNFVSLQKSKSCLYCVVDLHAITTFQKPNELNSNIVNLVNLITKNVFKLEDKVPLEN